MGPLFCFNSLGLLTSGTMSYKDGGVCWRAVIDVLRARSKFVRTGGECVLHERVLLFGA
jgi:hypothetical protein